MHKDGKLETRRPWILFICVWLLSGVLEFFFFYLLFSENAQSRFLLICSTHLGASLLYFLLSESGVQRRGFVWPIQFFFLNFCLPGLGFFFFPFFWFQKLEGNLSKTALEELSEEELQALERNRIPLSNKEERMQEGLDLEPYVDILAGHDIELKRGAIERIIELKSPESIRLLEAHRSDPSGELRFYVISALHRIQMDFEEELSSAKKEMQKNLYKVSARIYLAKVYFQYAESGLLDAAMRDYNLQEAIHHLRYALGTRYANASAFELLMQILLFQKDYAKASELLEEGKQEKWCDGDYYFRKKMEILYHSQKYAELTHFVSSTSASQLKSSEAQQIFYSWGGKYVSSL